MKHRSVCATLLGVSAVASSHAAPITDLRAFYIGDSITYGFRGEGDLPRDVNNDSDGVHAPGTIGGFRLQIDNLFQTDAAFAIDGSSETGLSYTFVGSATGDAQGETGIGEPDSTTAARLRNYGIPGISANLSDNFGLGGGYYQPYNFAYVNNAYNNTVTTRSLVDRFRVEYTSAKDGTASGEIRTGFAEEIYGASLSTQAAPNLVSVNIGANSISGAVGNLSYATNQVVDLMDTFVQLSNTTVDGQWALDPSAHIVISRILPTAYNSGTTQDRLNRIETTRLYNDAIETIANSYSSDLSVSVADLFKVSATVVDDYIEANWTKWAGTGPGVGTGGTAISYNVSSADDLRKLINPDQYDSLGNFNAALGDEWIDWVLEYNEADGTYYTGDLTQVVANTFLLADGLHPSALGYDLVGEIYYQHLLEQGLVARLGDMNGDTVTDADDVLSFVNALLTPGGDTNGIGADLDLVGDLNRDGLFNFDDIQPFAAAAGVAESSIYALIPEPGTLALLMIGGVGVLARRGRHA